MFTVAFLSSKNSLASLLWPYFNYFWTENSWLLDIFSFLDDSLWTLEKTVSSFWNNHAITDIHLNHLSLPFWHSACCLPRRWLYSMTNNKQPQAKQDRIFFAAVVKMCLVTILKKKLPVLNKKLTCVIFEQLLPNSFPQSCETPLLRKNW